MESSSKNKLQRTIGPQLAFKTTSLCGLSWLLLGLATSELATAASDLAPTSKIYLCKDESGRTITSDRPIPECANRAMKILGKDGAVRKVIPAPLTAEQREAAKLAEEKRKEEEKIEQAQKQKDQVLLNTYRSESDIEAARDRIIQQLRTDISEANQAAEVAEGKRRQAIKEQEKFMAKKTGPKSELAGEIEEYTQTANAERKRAEKLQLDLLVQKTKFESLRLRFQELNQRQAAKAKKP